ncbi:MAG: iron ABC transporter permease [Phycisphaeraceae bacterium]
MRNVVFQPRKVQTYLLLAGCLALGAVFLLLPIVLTIKDAFIERGAGGETRFTIGYVIDVFKDPVLVASLLHSLLIAVIVTALCLCVSLPLAGIATRYDFRGKAIFSALLLVPMILPPFVGAIGLRLLLGRFGSLNALLLHLGWIDAAHPLDILGSARLWGVIVMETLHLYPILYLNVAAAMANIDPAMQQAAENLGASRWTTFRRITLPLILPGVFAGATIVFIWSFTELGTPLMFDYTSVAPVQIFWQIQQLDSPRPFALVAVVLAISSLLYLLGKVTFGGRSFAASTRASVRATTIKLRTLPGLLALLPFIAITLLAVLPHIGVVLTSLTQPGTWYQSILPGAFTLEHYLGPLGALAHPLAAGSIQNSLIYSVLAMIVDVVIGLTIAYVVVRGRVWGGKLLDAMSMLPLAVPGLVLAFGYVAMSNDITLWLRHAGFAVPGILQVTGDHPNPILFLVIAYAVRRLPYVVRSAAAGLEQTPVELEEAAAVFGAGKLYSIRRVVMPLIMANLIAGGLLAFSFAMLEVSDSLILAQTQQYYPITKAIYVLFERIGDGPYVAGAMGVWGMALLTLTLVGASMMLGKRLGAIFRM